MNRYIYFIIIGILSLTSCKDYSDLKLVIKKNSFDVVNPEVEVALIGSEKISGILKMKVVGQTIGQVEIESFLDTEYKLLEFDFSKLADELNPVATKMQEKAELEILLVFINENEKLKIEQKILLKPQIPPLSKILRIEGGNFTKHPLDSSSILPIIISDKTRNIKTKYLYLDREIRKESEKIRIKLLVDTVFYKSFIWRYPVKSNKYYNNIDIESNLIDDIRNEDENLKTEYKGIMEDGLYVINDEYTVGDTKGEVGFYLININESGDYLIQFIGCYLNDCINPIFSNASFCNPNGDPRIEGKVCIVTKHFYGYNPYNIPFVGRAYGDIDKIYIDKMQVKFKIGEEIYFKKRVYLDGGYNRIPVKIIDKVGNITESYIAITIEQIKDTEIDIDNEINIEN